jgi:hypothetical protein
MKTTRWFSGAMLSCFMLMALAGASVQTTNAQSRLRIGAYDSRVVFVVYFNSKFNKSPMSELMAKMKTAKEKNDTQEIAKIEREGRLRQAMAHEQGFGTGSIRDIMEQFKDKVAALAKQEKLQSVVSKWELAYADPGVELVDVTEKIVAFFEPNEKTKTMMKEMMKQEPVKEAYLIED